MSLFSIKCLAALTVFLVTLIAAWYPFHQHRLKKAAQGLPQDFPAGEALAAGVFLGAGLMHMLADASSQFVMQGVSYPFPFLLAGITFLFLLWLEHLGREFYEHNGIKSPAFAVLAVVMLSIHAFLAGSALGLATQLSVLIVIFIAILAHKWAESFALALQINKTQLSHASRLIYFAVFSVMTPLGIFFGDTITQYLSPHLLLAPIFNSLAAGTFLYLGTLHGLTRSVMVQRCCNLKHFSYVIAGFALMAIVAIWT